VLPLVSAAGEVRVARRSISGRRDVARADPLLVELCTALRAVSAITHIL